MSQEEANEIVREAQRLRRTRRALKLGLPTAAALGAGAALAVGAIPGSGGVITGCYAGTTGATLTTSTTSNYADVMTEPPGALRVIDPSLPNTITVNSYSPPEGLVPEVVPNPAAACVAKEETQITWNQQGTPGPQGPAGPQGPGGGLGASGAPGAPLLGSTDFGLSNSSGDTFLKLDGITGPYSKTQDKANYNADYNGDIPIESFSFGASAPTQTSGSGGGAGKVSIGSFTITKALDSTSPQLFQAASAGTELKGADLSFTHKAAGKEQSFLEFKFTDVRVASIQEGQSADDKQPTEQVTFTFQKFSETLIQTDKANGGNETLNYNIGANVKS
jgi:type VI secretion system secreted protein Hcp